MFCRLRGLSLAGAFGDAVLLQGNNDGNDRILLIEVFWSCAQADHVLDQRSEFP